MRRIGLVLAVFIFQGIPAPAQTPLEILKQELQQAQQTHDETTTQNLSNFLDQLQAASASPDAAMDLYQKAGGKLPDSAPVQTQYEHETPDEKADREARDQANLANLGYVAELHCGLMRFGGLFVAKPKTPGLHDDWIAWLKNGAQIYLQIKPSEPPPSAQTDPNPQTGHGHRGARVAVAGSGDTLATDFKNTSLHDSIIGSYLGFHSWNDKTQGSWAVRDLPDLYRSEVLEPLREHPTAATLDAWDVYIALEHADATDPDKWDQVDSISLAFDRACDDYAVTPNMEKLATLAKIVTDNPLHPKLTDMRARASQLVDDYAARHPGESGVAVAAAPKPTPSTGPSVSVTTTTQGDTTVVTTHVNPAPSTNAPSAQ